MAFDSGYFTSTTVTVNEDGIPVGDKAKDAAFFALEKFHLFGNGISLIPTSSFYVAPKSGLIATVSAGWGIMEGYPFHLTEDLDITMTSSVSEQTLYIGVRLDVAGNTYTDNDVVARTTFVAATDRVFAIIVIPANAVTLTTAMITDTRYSATYCGVIDEHRIALAAIVAEAQALIDALIAEAVPAHASNHEVGGSDALAASSIGALPYDAISSNLIINNFSVNQRAVSGTVTLAAGVYGHDRWKGGASGGQYTFATSENVTTLTIAAGKSIIQVVEGLNLKSGTVCLSWTGTAQGKIGAGEFSASGVTGTATGGTNLNIEFNAGTLSNVQLNYGTAPLPYIPRNYSDELRLCRRYYAALTGILWCGAATSASPYSLYVSLRNEMRAAPTVVTTATSNYGFASAVTNSTVTTSSFIAACVATSTVPSGTYIFSYTADAEL